MAARKKTTRKSPRKRAAQAATGGPDPAAAATETALEGIRERLTRIEAWVEDHAKAGHPQAGGASLREVVERLDRLAQALAASHAASAQATGPFPSGSASGAEPPLDRQMLWAVTVVVVAVILSFAFLGWAGTLGGDAVAIVLVGFALYAALEARPLLALFGKRREPPAF